DGAPGEGSAAAPPEQADDTTQRVGRWSTSGEDGSHHGGSGAVTIFDDRASPAELVEAGAALEPAEPGLLLAAERQTRETSADDCVVDDHATCMEAAGERARMVSAPREH